MSIKAILTTVFILLLPIKVLGNDFTTTYPPKNMEKLSGKLHLKDGNVIVFKEIREAYCKCFHAYRCNWDSFSAKIDGAPTKFNASHVEQINFYNVKKDRFCAPKGSNGRCASCPSFKKQVVVHFRNGRKESFETNTPQTNKIKVARQNPITLELTETTLNIADVEKIQFETSKK